MSSIYCIWRWSDRLDTWACGRAVAAAQAEYGSAGQFESGSESQVALGGNLSGFLPEDVYDAQPILVSPQSWLIADVRLDNRAELERSLGIATIQAEGLADSTLLAHAWERWGPDCLDHIVGVFAFAVWDQARQLLFAARDHTGERPLFYHQAKDFFALASMPKGLLAIPGVNQGLNDDTLVSALALARYPQSVSFFRGIERLPPGHLLRVTPGRVEVTAYWRPFAAPGPRFRRNEEYAEAFLEIFDSAVEARLRSTGRVGTQLSAGLDSSSVTACAARLLAGRGERLLAFTAVPRKDFSGSGFPGRLADEGPGARDVAAMYPNIDHVLLDSAAVNMVETVTRMSDAAGEPIQNGVNSLWLAATLEAARDRGVGAMLIGMRGNLTLSHSGIEALGQMLRTGHWWRLAKTMHSFRRRGFVSLRNSVAHATTGLVPRGLHRWLHRAQAFDLTYSAVSRQVAEQQRLRDRMLEEFYANRFSTRADRLHLFQIYDMDTYSAAYQAVHGVDVRDPCADRRVVDFCFGIPSEQYVVGGMPRSLVRRAMRGRLPESTLTRTERGQQGADWALSIADALPGLRVQMRLNEGSPTARRLLDLPRMEELLATWPDDVNSMESSFAWCDALCRGFSFGYFMRRHETS